MSLTKTLGQFVSHISPNRQSRTLSVSRLGSRDYIGTMITGKGIIIVASSTRNSLSRPFHSTLENP